MASERRTRGFQLRTRERRRLWREAAHDARREGEGARLQAAEVARRRLVLLRASHCGARREASAHTASAPHATRPRKRRRRGDAATQRRALCGGRRDAASASLAAKRPRRQACGLATPGARRAAPSCDARHRGARGEAVSAHLVFDALDLVHDAASRANADTRGLLGGERAHSAQAARCGRARGAGGHARRHLGWTARAARRPRRGGSQRLRQQRSRRPGAARRRARLSRRAGARRPSPRRRPEAVTRSGARQSGANEPYRRNSARRGPFRRARRSVHRSKATMLRVAPQPRAAALGARAALNGAPQCAAPLRLVARRAAPASRALRCVAALQQPGVGLDQVRGSALAPRSRAARLGSSLRCRRQRFRASTACRRCRDPGRRNASDARPPPPHSRAALGAFASRRPGARARSAAPAACGAPCLPAEPAPRRRSTRW